MTTPEQRSDKNWSARLRSAIGTFATHPSLARDAAVSAILIIGIGVAGLFYSIEQLNRQSALAEVVNASGRLRMLSQQIAYATHRTADNDGAARHALPALKERFRSGLADIEARGHALGLFESDDPAGRDALANLQTEWAHYQQVTGRFLGETSGNAYTREEVHGLAAEAEKMLDAADAVVQTELATSAREKEKLHALIPAVFSLGIVAILLLGLYNYFLIRRPLNKIGTLFERIAAGDYTARVEVGRRDEFGQLAERLNRNVSTVAALHAEQLRAEQAIRESELRNRTLWEVSTDAIVMIDVHNTIRFTNPAVLQVFGYTQEELLGQALSLIQPPRFQQQHREQFDRYIQTRERRLDWSRVELTARHKSGQEIPVELSFAHMVLNGQSWFVGFFRDMTQRNAAIESLQIRKRAIDSTGEGIMITDAQKDEYPIIYINPALERITGRPVDSILGRNGRLLSGPAQGEPGLPALGLVFVDERDGTIELQGRRGDGEPYWIELSVAPVHNAGGEISHYVSIFKDITERKQYEMELVRSATYDALTGLPNRLLLQDRLQQAITNNERHKREVGVLFIDLDNFKTVNDSLGHHFGDRLLKAASAKLGTCLRDGDTVARWGGDEFVVLLPEMASREDIRIVAERILDQLHEPIFIDDREIYCTASIGGSIHPSDGATPEELLKHADAAMYQAKEHGKNKYHLYSRSIQASIDRRLALEVQLRKALQNEEFLLHFQPKVDIGSGRVVGAEALIRWQHPEHGMVSPALFIPVAEETGLILEIDKWVIRAACREVERRRTLGIACGSIAINLSARQFSRSTLCADMAEMVKRYRLQPGDIEIEITESTVMGNPAKAAEILQGLRALGFTLAIDDFGTGYSNLASLKNFPIHTLKIDKSFVQDPAMVRAIIQLAISYRLKTVAEGVEDQETVAMLATMGCDIIQGFVYSKPLPLDQFIDFAHRLPPGDAR